MACPSLSLWSRNVWRKPTLDQMSSVNMLVPLGLSAFSSGLFVDPTSIVPAGYLFRDLERLKVGFNLRSSEYPLSLHLFRLSNPIDMFTISSFPRALTLPLSHLGRWMGKLNPLRFVNPISSQHSFKSVTTVQLASHEQLLKQLRSGLFKPNCGLGEHESLVMSF